MTAASPSPTTRSPRHPLWLTVTLALWLATVGNLPLWRALWALPDIAGWRGGLFMVGCALFIAATLVLVLAPLSWPRLSKPLALLCLASAAGSSHFMLAYGVVIDPRTLEVDQAETKKLRAQLQKKRGRSFQGELLSLVKLPHRMAVSPHTGKAVAAKR